MEVHHHPHVNSHLHGKKNFKEYFPSPQCLLTKQLRQQENCGKEFIFTFIINLMVE